MRYRSLRVDSLVTMLLASISSAITAHSHAQPAILDPRSYSRYVAEFNSLDDTPDDGAVSNAEAWQWVRANVPFFDCPDERLEKAYYFRWWTYRKHIRHTPQGHVITEFLRPVSHAGPYNTISCAFGHHLAEGRWIRDQRPLDEYVRFWFRSDTDGGPAKHFHKYSSWAAAALYERYLVTLDREFIVSVLDDLVADYAQWEAERQRPDGLFWQYDVADGMEESISGSRTAKHVRPTINSYMAANARAIAQIAALADRRDLRDRFQEKHEILREKLIDALWDPQAEFFKVRFEDGSLSDAREAIGFIPWMFDMPHAQHAAAWRQLKHPGGFWAPCGLTTAERRHPAFRTHGVGTCEWDGAVWPFATSQTLAALANVLRGPPQTYVTRRDFFEALRTYAGAHQKDGRPYIGEYHDEVTGDWLITGSKAARSTHYNHSTFCDLVISGLIGIVPGTGPTVDIHPLLPSDTWDWFCLDGVSYHGHSLTVIWDRTGKRYGREAGFAIWCNGRRICHEKTLRPISVILPRAL